MADYKITDRRLMERKGYPETVIYPNLNTTYTAFQQFSFNRNSPTFGNWDRNRSILNYTGLMYIAVDENSSRMAEVPLGLYIPKPEDGFSTKRARKALNLSDKLRRKSVATGQDFLQVTDPEHPIVQILASPNDIQTPYTFFYKVYAFLQLAGQAPILKLRNEAGEMTGMVTLDPRAVKPIRDFAKDPWKIQKYVYIGANGLNAPLNVEDIIWVAYPSVTSYTETWCPAAAAWNDIILSAEKTNADLAYNGNRMRPDFIMSCKNVDQGEMERIAAQVEDKLRGSSNTGNMLMLNSEQMSLEPLQNFDGYVAGDPDPLIRKILAYFRYPYAKYASTDSNRASAVVMMSEWMKDLKPTLGIVEEALCKAFREEFPELDDDAELEFENIDIRDEEFDLKKYTQMWQTGAIDRYTYKQAMGLSASDSDIDVYFKGQATQLAVNTTPEEGK